MTDISVSSTTHHVEDRSWILSPWGQGPGETPGGTIDVSACTDIIANGYIKSGAVLAKLTSGGKLVPYDTSGSGGAEVAYGFLHSSVKADVAGVDVGCAVVCAGFIKESRLPFSSGLGSLDADARTALKLCHFTA